MIVITPLFLYSVLVVSEAMEILEKLSRTGELGMVSFSFVALMNIISVLIIQVYGCLKFRWLWNLHHNLTPEFWLILGVPVTRCYS